MTRRDRLDLYVKMLQIYETPSTMSVGIPELSLSGSQNGRYFGLLLRRGLVAQCGTRKGRALYEITEKGGEFLQYYNAMQEMLDE